MSVYSVGDDVPLRYEVRNDTGTLVSGTGVVTVRDPNGVVTTPAVTQTSTGILDATVNQALVSGIWTGFWTITSPYDDVTPPFQFTVSSAPPRVYYELARFRNKMKLTNGSEDSDLFDALRSASRRIDGNCGGRQFWVDPAVSVREYSSRGRVVCDYRYGDLFLVDDIATAIGLIVEVGSAASWTVITDYTTEPDNALSKGKPVTALRRTRNRWVTDYGQRLRVTARHGWPWIPDEVVQACKILATRHYTRKDSPEGVAGSAEWGAIHMRRTDPDVADLLTGLDPGATFA